MPAFDSTSVHNDAFVQAMWLAANTTDSMTAKLQGIADTYTTYMRTALTAPPDSFYMPTTSRIVIVVHVRWPWLAYPLTLVLAGYIFLAATLIQTSRYAVRPWKSQRLPLLLATVDGVVRESATGGLHLNSGLEDRIGHMKVQVEFDGQDQLAFKGLG